MKIVKKKAIATVAALALAGLFGLTQVTTASASQWDSTTIDLYRGVIKVYKNRLPQGLTVQDVEQKFAQEKGIVWQTDENNLEEQFYDEILDDYLAHYQKMIKNYKTN